MTSLLDNDQRSQAHIEVNATSSQIIAQPTMSLPPRSPHHNPLEIIKECKAKNKPVYIAGPMVRYSKLPFRQLLRYYNVDIVYTPMILAREFVRHPHARLSDFSTNPTDRPLILQVGVNNVTDLLRVVEMVKPYVDGIGLNCGCPIKDQVREGIGAALMSKKDLVASMVKAVKDKWSDDICIETKIRVHPDVNETIEFVKEVEKAGVDFITVHGRTKNTRSSVPVDLDKIKIIKSSVNVPVIANGDCRSVEDAENICNFTGCDGVMAVRGVLDNPAMFAGFEKCPWGAIERFWDLAMSYGLPFRLMQHHLACMMEGLIDRKWIIELNECESAGDLLDWFDEKFWVKRPDDEGFGEAVEVQWREKRDGVKL
ncbi:tRNA dihydrouridine synthase [Martiniozyma asiatica (nom. inval.)]|nr:tRNA dihydrouridine synthase [Martiniozyma asiatica]